MEISALLISKISVLPMHQFGFLHGTGQPDISVQMWVPYIDVNFIGNVIFLTFSGCTWIPSTGKTLTFCRFLLSLHPTTDTDNNVAFCFNKTPVLPRQSSAFQLKHWSHSEQRSHKVSGAGSRERAHGWGVPNWGAFWGYKYESLEDFILLKVNVPQESKKWEVSWEPCSNSQLWRAESIVLWVNGISLKTCPIPFHFASSNIKSPFSVWVKLLSCHTGGSQRPLFPWLQSVSAGAQKDLHKGDWVVELQIVFTVAPLYDALFSPTSELRGSPLHSFLIDRCDKSLGKRALRGSALSWHLVMHMSLVPL